MSPAEVVEWLMCQFHPSGLIRVEIRPSPNLKKLWGKFAEEKVSEEKSFAIEISGCDENYYKPSNDNDNIGL